MKGNKWKQINVKLLAMEGRELEDEEIREWNRLITIEAKMIDREDEKQERKESKNRKNTQTVPANMEREKTSL